MDFHERLEKAIHRGQKRGESRAEAARAKALSVEELKRLHSDQRLALSDYIEKCLASLPQHFPGFDLETIYGDAGWGAAIRRDDAGDKRGSVRANFYSRLELTIRPISSAYVLELAAKGTIRNKEVMNRKHFEKVTEADLDSFHELIDLWVLEFAELFAAAG
jgi:hypothetical protein